MRLFAAIAFFAAAPLLAQSCNMTVNPTTFTIPADSFTGEIAVTQPAGSDCGTFSVSTPVSWIHITGGQTGGTLPGKVLFTVDSNPSARSRSDTIRVSTQNVTITQSGATCVFSTDPKSQNFTIDGGPGSLAVTANCSWAAFSGALWIAVAPGSAGSSNSTVNYSVDANHCVSARNGSITVSTGQPGPPVLAITQDGSPANLTLSESSATKPSTAADYRITVATGDGCAWAAFSDVNWIQVASTSNSGIGNGGLVYHLLENKSIERKGNIHIGALLYPVTQQAAPPPPVVLSSIANAANYTSDGIAPGEIVTLFGSNLGPPSIVTLQLANGKVTDTLSGTQVLFDGVAAPMVYTLDRQVSAVVPYSLAGKSSTKVQVQYQGTLSNTVTINVQAAVPGIFTLDASGSGPGAILNQDLTVNSSSNPAAKGSVIAIYMTGGGVTSPASGDGSVTGAPPPLLAQTPTVTIGGLPAVVKFAGGAPDAVAGLTQINAEVPAGVTAAVSLPVVIKIGNFSSTGAATVTVR